MTANAAQTWSEERLSRAGIWKGAAAGGSIGAVLNVIVALIAGAAGVNLAAEFQPGQTMDLQLPQVVLATLVPAAGAALVATLLRRFTGHPARWFVIAAVVFGAVSMGGPFSLAGASAGLRGALVLMHLVAGVAITGGILLLGRR